MPWSLQVLSRVKEAGAEVTHIRPPDKLNSPTWLLRILLPERLQDRFGTAPEVLLLLIAGKVQAQDLERAAAESSAETRLDPDLVIVAERPERPIQRRYGGISVTMTDALSLEERLKLLPGRGQRVPWASTTESFPPLPQLLENYLPRYNLFEERDPVRGRQVLGRQREIADLWSRLERGDAVGVFGLRKVGKTTLARAVTDQQDPISARPTSATNVLMENLPHTRVAWLDAQLLAEHSFPALIGELVGRVRERLGKEGIPVPLGDTGTLQHMERVMRGALGIDERRWLIVIDEYDLLFSQGGKTQPIAGLGRLFGLIRGLAQETQRVTLVLIGRDPSFISEPRLDGDPNPLLAWFTSFWVGPLVNGKDTELLRKLGKRVGLAIGPETSALARKWTGGHPLLHRIYGSALWDLVRRDKTGLPWDVPTDPDCAQALRPFRSSNDVRVVVKEIKDLLSTSYPDAYKVLNELAVAEDDAVLFRRYYNDDNEGLDTLVNFGLAREPSEAGGVIPEYLRWYLRAR